MRILLAEDEQQLARVVMTALAHEGYQVDWAKDGQQAVQLAQQTVYDLMILDIMMPVMNGIEALKEIRASGRSRRLPDQTLFTQRTPSPPKVHVSPGGSL